MFFCKRVIFVATLLLIILSLYSNIFDIAESLTQKQSSPYLVIQPSNVAFVGRPIVNVVL